jgi:hypothetical protein
MIYPNVREVSRSNIIQGRQDRGLKCG